MIFLCPYLSTGDIGGSPLQRSEIYPLPQRKMGKDAIFYFIRVSKNGQRLGTKWHFFGFYPLPAKPDLGSIDPTH